MLVTIDWRRPLTEGDPHDISFRGTNEVNRARMGWMTCTLCGVLYAGPLLEEWPLDHHHLWAFERAARRRQQGC